MDMELAVVDRIVDGIHAVLLVGTAETQRIVPLSKLPDAITEGSWLQVRFAGDILVTAVIDQVATKTAAQRIMAKMDRLRQRGRSPE